MCARVLEASSPQIPFLTGKVDFHQVLPTQDVGVEVAVLRDGREAGQVQEGGDVNHLPIDVLVAGPRLKRRPRTGVSVTALSDLQSRVLLSDAGSVEGSMRENSTPPLGQLSGLGSSDANRKGTGLDLAPATLPG